MWQSSVDSRSVTRVKTLEITVTLAHNAAVKLSRLQTKVGQIWGKM